MAVERAGPPAVRVAPDVAQQLIAGEHSGRLAGERAEQLVLLGGQLDSVPAHLHSARGQVDLQLADAQEPGGVAGAGSPKQRRKPCAELGVRVRLGQHIVPSAVEQPDPVQLIDPRGQHDQRRGWVDGTGETETVARADRVDQPERLAIHVEDDHIGLLHREARERLLTRVRRPDLVSIGGQVLGVLCPGRLCARSGRPVMSGPAPSR
jgi:hypothetical protein